MKNKKLFTTIIVIASVIVLLGVATITWAFAPHSKSVSYIAHRGNSISSLGNTEEAFINAGKLPFYGIETDIKVTKDGKYVCVHDDEVEFDDGSILTVVDSTFEELTAKKLKDTENAYICTFERYLEICSMYGKTAIIELKMIFNTTQIQHIFYEIDTTYSRENISFIAFDLSNLLICRTIDSECNCQYLVNEEENIQLALDNNMNIDIKWRLLNRKIVKSFHDKGLTVDVWTVNNRFVRTYCDVVGVDFITTDEFY